MLDPFLSDLMHGSESGKTSSQNHKKDRFGLALDKVIKEQVETRLAAELHNNKLLTPEQSRIKLEEEIRHDASSNQTGQQVSLAMRILMNEGSQLLEKEEYTNLQENIRKMYEHLSALSELNVATLQTALTLPPDCGKNILKVAINQYNQGLVDEALAIFHFLVLVNPKEADYWFRFGLVAQKCEKYSLALSAFTETSNLAPEFPGSHVYAALCHLSMGSREGAMAELATAKKTVNGAQMEDQWKEHISGVESLLKMTK